VKKCDIQRIRLARTGENNTWSTDDGSSDKRGETYIISRRYHIIKADTYIIIVPIPASSGVSWYFVRQIIHLVVITTRNCPRTYCARVSITGQRACLLYISYSRVRVCVYTLEFERRGGRHRINPGKISNHADFSFFRIFSLYESV